MKYTLLPLAVLLTCSCQDFVSGLAKLHMEFIELEAEVEKINTTTASIAVIIEKMDDEMISRIDEIIEDGICIGYTITYKNGRTVSVYHGSDGEKGDNGDDGHNGQDGHSPILSIRKADDGIWYWTVDGQWMTDANGDKIPVAGENGTSPRLKIENGRWLISCDGGLTWQDYGEASTSSGNSPILNVDYRTYENRVVFTMRDGTEFSVPKEDDDSRLICDSPSVIKAAVRHGVNISFHVEGNSESSIQVDVMAGEMFKWTLSVKDKSSCTINVIALDTASDEDLFTVFVNCGQKTWMKVFSFDLSKPEKENDLSWEGTSNCYIVNKSGTFHFDAQFKGNSSNLLDGTPASAAVIWESFGTNVAPSAGDIIRNVSLSDGFVYFTVPDPIPTGNAGIAVKDSKGTILWSWHIWVCPDFYPELSSTTLCGTIYMDRNLGAITSDSNSTLSYGNFYVNGRKDPVMGPLAHSGRVVSTPNSWVYRSLSDEQHTYSYFTANPMTFNNEVEHWHCTDFYWSDDKSINDPCPPGWVIPKDIKFSSYASYQEGYLLKGETAEESLFLPSAGYNWTSTAAYAEYWLTGQNDNYYHHYKFAGTYHQHERTTYDFYYSVRCCKQ